MSNQPNTTVVYRIDNISGVQTYHRVQFVDGVRAGWRQTQTLSELLEVLDRASWATLLDVQGNAAQVAQS